MGFLNFLYATTQSAVSPAGPQAGRIDGLLRVMLYLLSAIYIVVMIVLAVAAFRRRGRSEAPATGNNVIAEEHDRERRFSRTVTISVVTTAAILLGLLVSSFLVGRAIHSNPDP